MHSAIRAGNLQCGGPTGPASPPTPLPPTPPPAPLRPTPAPTPLPPSSLLPGCYFKQPEASTRGCGGPFLQWERDAWGEANVNSRASEAACLGRKQGHDAYCEVITEWLFVPMPLPKQIPTPIPTPSFTSTSPFASGGTSSISFETSKCMGLHSAAGATFQ